MRKFKNIANSDKEAFKDRVGDTNKRKELIKNIWEIELGLKNDLGIFELEFFNPDKSFRDYNEFEDIQKRYTK